MKFATGFFSGIVMSIILFTVYESAFAEVYKWVDKDGKTVYSQSKPSGDVKYETVSSPADVDSARALKKLRDDKIRAQKLMRERERVQSAQRQKKAKSEERQKNCDLARENLASLQPPRISVKLPDGSFTRMSEEERQSRIKQAQAKIQEWCE